MKTIHLLRHAKSSWSEAGLEDHARPLDERGEKDARSLAKRLRASPIALDLVLCSTALRARQTLDPLLSAMGEAIPVRFEEKLFHASPEAILGMLRSLPKRVDHVLVVAHSPGLDGCIGMLAGHGDPELREALAATLPTCTLVTLTVDVDRFAEIEPKSATLVSALRGGTGKRSQGFEIPKVHKATKAKAIHLDPRARWSEAAEDVLAACRSHVKANVKGAEDGEMESVHQLRVALRRSRVALQLFGRLLPDAEREELRGELRWLAAKLGALREAQVFEDDVLGKMRKSLPRSPARKALERATEAEIVAQMHEARASLRGPRGKRTLERLKELAFVDSKRARKRARRQAKKRLERRLERVLEHASAGTSQDPAELHELRKELKKLRYASEFVSSLFDVDAVHPYVASLEHLQDVIGALQDRAVSERLVGQLLHGPEGEEHLARATELVGRFYGKQRQPGEKSVDRAIARFVATEPFWR